MNTPQDRRAEQIAILSGQRDAREIKEIVAPVWPELSLDAGVELMAAMQDYRDHPVRAASDLATALITIMGPRNAALVAEYVAIKTAVQ